MDFEILGDVTDIETIAVGKAIRELPRVRRQYGTGRWRKLKGVAAIRLADGKIRRPSCTGTRRMGLGAGSSSGNAIWTNSMKKSKPPEPTFAVCINNRDYPASLELHKIYRVLPDEDAAEGGDIRVVDESGEDYLYSANDFVVIEVPAEVRVALLQAS